MTHSNISRRNFLKSTAGAGALGFGAPGLLFAGSPNQKLNVAFIGVGRRGGSNVHTISKDNSVNVAALIDVDAEHLATQAKKFPNAKTYIDFRKFYEDDLKYVDAVVVSTPEHTHAYATLPALRAGKHVYCEKPLTHNVQESRLVMETAAKTKVATQMGTQIHGLPNYRRVVELIQTGAIGDVTECHVWVSRAWGLQSKEEQIANKDQVYVTERPKEGMKPPERLNWDLWLGPAKYRPYHDVYFPGPKWYRWWDFGNGTMSDLGSHWNDLPFWALKLDAPKTIEAFGPEPHPEIAPASMTAVYEYGPRGKMPACELHWHQGTHKPKIWKEKGIPQWKNGVLFIGSKGMLLSDYRKHLLLPEEDFKDFEPPKPFIPDSPGHHEEWVLACKTGSATGSPFSYAGPLTEANHLGNVAFRAGKKIQWNAKEMKIPNNCQAESFLSRVPRKGWSLLG